MHTQTAPGAGPIVERSVIANGIRFHYATLGQGPLVLLLHGFPERWFSYRHQIPFLADLGFRVVAPDLRGYGETERPNKGYDLPNLARDVVELIRALGEQSATVIGHDWGGAITWETVARHPPGVDRFVVLNAPHPAVFAKHLIRSWSQVRKSWYMFFFQLPFLPEWFLKRNRAESVVRAFVGSAVDRSRFDADTLERYRESLLLEGAARAELAYYRALFTGIANPVALARRLASYKVIERPGMLIWAEEDMFLEKELIPGHYRYARDLEVRRIPACRHFVQMEQPEQVNLHLKDFLRQGRGRL